MRGHITLRLLIGVFVAIAGLSATASAQTPVLEYYHLDAIGSVRAVTNQTGGLVRRHDFFPFGEEYLPQPLTGDLHRFAGKPRDGETGLDYFGARFHASRFGRFTSVDPIFDVDSSLEDPQRWNRYSYSLNRPFRFTDPNGANPILLQKLLELARGASRAPVAQRAQRVVVDQSKGLWNALTRLFNTPGGNELVQGAAELTAGSDLGPIPQVLPNVGAVIGHFDAAYAKVGREIRVAVFDLGADMYNRLSPEQRQKANEAFLEGVVKQGLNVLVVTKGHVNLKSTLAWEIKFLRDQGYEWDPTGVMLVAPRKK